jgi:hypothetical protein
MAKAVVREVQHGQGYQYLGVKLMADEEHPKVPVLQQFGYASAPLSGSEALILCLGGDRSNAVVINSDDPRYRPMDLEPGEIAIYSSGDMMGDEEELPSPLEGPSSLAQYWPQDWPAEPPEEELPKGEAWQPPLCRLRLLPDRSVEIFAGDMNIRSLGDVSIAAEGDISLICKGELTLASAELARIKAPETGHENDTSDELNNF